MGEGARPGRGGAGGSVERARTCADRPAGVRTTGRDRRSSGERRGGSGAVDGEQGREESMRERDRGGSSGGFYRARERESQGCVATPEASMPLRGQASRVEVARVCVRASGTCPRPPSRGGRRQGEAAGLASQLGRLLSWAR